MSQSEATRPAPRRTWIELEAPEVIELKRIVLDKDAVGAGVFFHDVVVPKVRAAAERQGIVVAIEEGPGHERLPG
jgi:hypothetical protein